MFINVYNVKLNNYSSKVNEINFFMLARQHGIYFNCVLVQVTDLYNITGLLDLIASDLRQ